jgi:hypothetical protein
VYIYITSFDQWYGQYNIYATLQTEVKKNEGKLVIIFVNFSEQMPLLQNQMSVFCIFSSSVFFLTGIKTPCAGEISAWAAWREIGDTRKFCAGIEGLGS